MFVNVFFFLISFCIIYMIYSLHSCKEQSQKNSIMMILESLSLFDPYHKVLSQQENAC